jgi:hypothetical protein
MGTPADAHTLGRSVMQLSRATSSERDDDEQQEETCTTAAAAGGSTEVRDRVPTLLPSPPPAAIPSTPAHSPAAATPVSPWGAPAVELASNEFATPAAISTRRSLRTDPRVQAWIDVFWRTFPRGGLGYDMDPGISKHQYLAQHALMYKALHSSYDPLDMYEQGLLDWSRDVWFSNSPGHLDEDSFGDALFEVADLWTYTMDPNEYVHFLADLYHRTTDLRSWMDVSETGEKRIVTKYVWKRLKYVACAQVYSSFQYSGVPGQNWKEAIDVVHLLDDTRGGAKATMHPGGQSTVEAQAKAVAQGLFQGATSPASFAAHMSTNALTDSEDESDGDYAEGELDENGLPRRRKRKRDDAAAKKEILDPTQILSMLPPPPLAPPSLSFLQPPPSIPTHSAMFSDPLMELGLKVLDSSEQDGEWQPRMDEIRETLEGPTGGQITFSTPTSPTNTSQKKVAASNAGAKSKDPPPNVKKGRTGAGAAATPAGGKKPTPSKKLDPKPDDEPTEEELQNYLVEHSKVTGVKLPVGKGGRAASMKALLINHARIVLKQRKRDAVI